MKKKWYFSLVALVCLFAFLAMDEIGFPQILNLNGNTRISTYANPGGNGYFTLDSLKSFVGGGSGNTYTVNNGLREDPADNFKLGGTLIENTTINQDAFSLRLDRGDFFQEWSPNNPFRFEYSSGNVTSNIRMIAGGSMRFQYLNNSTGVNSQLALNVVSSSLLYGTTQIVMTDLFDSQFIKEHAANRNSRFVFPKNKEWAGLETHAFVDTVGYYVRQSGVDGPMGLIARTPNINSLSVEEGNLATSIDATGAWDFSQTAILKTVEFIDLGTTAVPFNFSGSGVYNITFTDATGDQGTFLLHINQNISFAYQMSIGSQGAYTTTTSGGLFIDVSLTTSTAPTLRISISNLTGDLSIETIGSTATGTTTFKVFKI